jgi:putative transposase
LSHIGLLVLKAWQALPAKYPHVVLDCIAIMPEHVHGFLALTSQSVAGLPDGPRPGMSDIVRAFKSNSSREINLLCATPGAQFWDRGFYDHVVRTEHDAEVERIRTYILQNQLALLLDLKHGE